MPASPFWQVPALHPVYARLLAALLARQGIAVDDLLARAGLNPGMISGDTALLPFGSVHALIVAALDSSARPWLGLEFGAAAQIHTHGIVGNATVASGTLEAALRTITRFAALRTRLVLFEIDRGPQLTTLRIAPAFDLGAAGSFIVDALLVMIESLLLALSARPFEIARYQLPQAAPPWEERYRQALAGEVFFACGSGVCMHFDNRTLDQVCITADAQAYARAAVECERDLVIAAGANALSERIRAVFAAGEGQYPTAEALATQLHLSPRNLFRRLRREGVGYRELVDEHRCERACWLLRHTELSVESIAERLGYADTSNFSRTFRRWLGSTPRQYRERASGSA
jgi:AraC-like DNA-binding protein